MCAGRPGQRGRHGVAVAQLDLILRIVGEVMKCPDDTAAAVAAWSLLHGFAVLAMTGQFGAGGPKRGFEVRAEAMPPGLPRIGKPSRAARS